MCKRKDWKIGMIYDLVILGSGPAGLAAAIYASRAQLHAIIVEKSMMSGGQVLTTYEVDNYPGLQGIGGFDLGMKFREHADHLGAKFIEDEVISIQASEACEEQLHAAEVEEMPGVCTYKIVGQADTYEAKTVLIAAGARHRKLGVPGEEELSGMGVSYCATCDGAFFRNKDTAVIGGGDVALEDAIFLSRMCRKVYLIHRRDELRGAKTLQEQVMAAENIEVIWDTVVERISGQSQVESLGLRDVKTGESSDLQVQGVFIAVGILPNSQPFEGLVDMDKQHYIIAGEDGKTSAPGIFAAGDIRTKELRQIITAAADGANCVTSVQQYLTGV